MGNQIFISYRRDGGEFFGKILYDKLIEKGYNVFYDVEVLKSGAFNKQLYRKIDECLDFILILPPNALDRCIDEDDWVRKEIIYAMKKKKNIIPILMRGFTWPDSMPHGLEQLPLYESEILSTTASNEHIDATVNVLCNRLLQSTVKKSAIRKLINFLRKWWFIFVLLFLYLTFPADDKNQQHYLWVNEAYEEMNAGNYEIALQKFYLYEDGHTGIYWLLQDLLGEEKYKRNNIEEAIELCEEQIRQNSENKK